MSECVELDEYASKISEMSIDAKQSHFRRRENEPAIGSENVRVKKKGNIVKWANLCVCVCVQKMYRQKQSAEKIVCFAAIKIREREKLWWQKAITEQKSN